MIEGALRIRVSALQQTNDLSYSLFQFCRHGFVLEVRSQKSEVRSEVRVQLAHKTSG